MKLAAAVPNRILLATYARCIPATYLRVSRASRAATAQVYQSGRAVGDAPCQMLVRRPTHRQGCAQQRQEQRAQSRKTADETMPKIRRYRGRRASSSRLTGTAREQLGGEVSSRQIEHLVDALILLPNMLAADYRPAPSRSCVSPRIPRSSVGQLVALFTVFSAYQPPAPTLQQHIPSFSFSGEVLAAIRSIAVGEGEEAEQTWR
jgi:hypothetical protein